MHCRTCFEIILENQTHYDLDELGLNQKTLADIILEIAKIDLKVNSTVCKLCSLCTERIKSAYELILQIQKVNEQWISRNEASNILDELPIDINETSWEIKPDVDSFIFDPDDSKDVLSENFTSAVDVKSEPIKRENKVTRKNKFNQSLETKEEAGNELERVSNLKRAREESKQADVGDTTKPRRGRPRKVKDEPIVQNIKPRRIQKKYTRKRFSRDNDSKSESLDESEGFAVHSDTELDNDDSSNSSENWTEKKVKKRKSYQRRQYDNICGVCGKSYFKHKDLIAHVKEHSIEPEFSCDYCDQMFLQKEKLDMHMKVHSRNWINNTQKRAPNSIEFNFVKRLYEKQNIKLIKCQLCNRDFKQRIELRDHLLIHKDAKTITQLPNDIYFEKSEQTEDELKSRICKDIEKNKFTEYYMIVNENGYELCLSETDDATDNEDNIEDSKNYKCMLCNQTFNRNYKIFAHSLEIHSNENAPFRCSVCKFNFVSEEMLHQHIRRHCRNKYKKFKCSHCPGRFVWEENSINHNCPNPYNTPYRNYNKHKKVSNLQCEKCDKIFVWLRDLKRHQLIHAADNEKLNCKFCKRKFNRKDHLKRHLKQHHNEEKNIENALNELKSVKKSIAQVKDVSEHLKRPHGCKIVECMICQSKQMRISDLKEHLLKHQNDNTFADNWDNIETISELLYPELAQLTNKDELVARINIDLAAKEFERFYSITNEAGYELNLNSSETDSDSEPDNDNKKEERKQYICEICNIYFDRKYKIFEHQSQQHNWHEAQYFCNHCGARFVSEQLLNWHYERQCKNPLKRFMCKKCSLRFVWKQNRATHMRTHIETENKEKTITISCPHCKRFFTNKCNLDRHLQMSTCYKADIKALNCFYCARKFFHIDNLTAHMLRHGVTAIEIPNAETLLKATNNSNGTKKILCCICNTDFPSISALRIHLFNESNSSLSQHYNIDSPLNYMITNSLGFEMQIDDSETEDEYENVEHDSLMKSTYQCKMCTLVFKRKYQMSQHQFSYHKYEELPFKCERCVFRTVSQDILDHHMRSQCFNDHKKIVCDICQYKFMWAENLETHKRLQHSEVQKLNVTQKIFECKDCLSKFSSRKILNAHMKKKHYPLMTDANTSDKISKGEKIFLCTTCGVSLHSKASFTRHIRCHNNENPFICDVCDKTFPCTSQLLNHRKTHTSEKTHICTVCNRGFTRAKGLISHMRTHTGERPLNCPYCEKKFSSYSSLVVHRRRHTGERPYVCKVCGASFIKNELLKKHRNLLGHNELTTTEVKEIC